jgi:hypothetical protein
MMDEGRRGGRHRPNDDPFSRLIVGLALLGFGVIAWLDHQGSIDGGDYYSWWPLIPLALSLTHAMRRRWAGAIIYAVIGLSFLPPAAGLRSFRPSSILGLWPLLISAGGMTLVMQALRPAAKDAKSSGAFRALAWMGGGSSRVVSENFVGGDVVAVMGGWELNLTHAQIATEAVIDVLAFWGGLEIRVPSHWTIDDRVTALLGGVTNKTSNPTGGDGPRLVLRGTVIMGGLEIRNAREAA